MSHVFILSTPLLMMILTALFQLIWIPTTWRTQGQVSWLLSADYASINMNGLDSGCPCGLFAYEQLGMGGSTKASVAVHVVVFLGEPPYPVAHLCVLINIFVAYYISNPNKAPAVVGELE